MVLGPDEDALPSKEPAKKRNRLNAPSVNPRKLHSAVLKIAPHLKASMPKSSCSVVTRN